MASFDYSHLTYISTIDHIDCEVSSTRVKFSSDGNYHSTRSYNKACMKISDISQYTSFKVTTSQVTGSGNSSLYFGIFSNSSWGTSGNYGEITKV